MSSDRPAHKTETDAQVTSNPLWDRLAHALSLIPAWLWIPGLSLCLTALFAVSPLHQKLLQSADDLHQRVFAREQPFDASLVVDIDDASLRDLQSLVGPWPFKRDLYAAVAGYLKEMGAKVVVFDILFADAREGDQILRASVEQGAMVLAASGLTQTFHIDAQEKALRMAIAWPATPDIPATEWLGLTLPSAGLLTAQGHAPSVGVISVLADGDGILRSMPLLHRVDEQFFPSLAVAAHFSTRTGQPPLIQASADPPCAGV